MLVLGRVKSQEGERTPEAWITMTIPPSNQPRVIEVGIVDVGHNKARLGIVADRVVNIARNELL